MKGENLKPVIYSHKVKKGTPSQGTFTHTAYLKVVPQSVADSFLDQTQANSIKKNLLQKGSSLCANLDEDSPPCLPQGLHLPLPIWP